MANDRQSLFDRLRAQWPLFEYEAYRWWFDEEGLRMEFDFRMGEHRFRPTTLLERRPFFRPEVPVEEMDRLVFNIGMAELVSYWKCACPPRVLVRCGHLDSRQLAFWKKLYWHGLGEFFYTNGIATSRDAFMSLECDAGSEAVPDGTRPLSARFPFPDATLVPVGGGKDSVVTLELLARAGCRLHPLIMNPRGATVECVRVAGYSMDEAVVFRRTLDAHMLELNAQGFLNGHTPFSAMLAFYTALAAFMTGIPNVALSNENSANEPTVPGSTVNHQYSKSLEFEDDYRAYMAPLLPGYNYFSFLRPLCELHIARLFSRVGEDYWDVFRSCNVGSKQDVWCGHCAKCLFAFIILSPFIPHDRLVQIFGHDLLHDPSLRHELDQLTGRAATKPFECVGTVGEVQTALALASGQGAPDLSLFDLADRHNLADRYLKILKAACSDYSN